MAEYEGMFQDRYTKALSMFADAAAQGKDPRELLTEMQANPTYGQATGRGILPSGSMTDVEFQSDAAPPIRPIGAGATSDMEFQQYMKATGSGGINTLVSTPNELLLNLGRKLTGE